MTLVECPAAEQLACFLDGALAPTELAELEVHLGACDRCCAIVAELAGAADETGDEQPRNDGFDDRVALGKLGRYVLLERVGAGGMGIVWAAYDTELERRVALKLLRSQGGDAGADRRRRLVREARAMARVSHPNVVAVHDVVEEDDRVFMTMELVVGRTLGAWLREGNRDWRAIVAVFVAAGRGLAAAHACGVVHRDFKPDNVMLSEREGAAPHVRVGDFGLAHTGYDMPSWPGDRAPSTPVHDDSSVSIAGLVGTPAYMAPEQFVGGAIDARTDQFAFCIAIWEALFGVRPFRGNSVSALAEAIASAHVDPPSDRRGVPARLEAALRRGLAREPDARWPNMDALLNALEGTLHGRRALVWIAAGVLATGSIVALAWPARSQCDNTPPWLASAWGDAARTRIVDAATARGDVAASLATPLVQAVDEQVTALGVAFARSCRATFDDHVATAEDHDARIACLQRGAAAIGVLAEFAATTDELGLARALRGAEAIADKVECDELARVRSDLPWLSGTGDRTRALALELTIQRASQLRRLGELASARELLGTVAAANEPGLETLAVAAEHELALVEQREVGTSARFHDVLAHATTVGNDVVVFDALAQLAFEAGTRANDRAAAEAYGELALAFVNRSRRGDDGRGRVLLALGQTRERAGDVAGARAALQEAEAAFAASGTLDLPGRLPLWVALALIDELDGDLAGAERRYDDARRRIELAYGDYHPDVAVALEYLAIVRRKRGAYDEALAAAERSRAIRSAVLGDEHPETAAALALIGNVNLDLRRWDAAESALGAAIAIWRARSPEHRGIALAEGSLAEALVLRDRPDDALVRYRDALALGERALGNDHPELAFFLLGIGNSELALGRPGDALAPLERAATLIGETRGDPMLRAHVEVTLAQALIRSGGDRQRARTLVDAARHDLAKAAQLADAGRVAREIEATAAEL